MFEESHPLYWYHIFKPCSIIGSPSCRGDVSVVQVMYVGFMMGYLLVFDEYIFLMSDEVTHIIPVTSPLDLHETMTSVFCVVEAPFLRCLSSFSCFFSRSLGGSENTGAEREWHAWTEAYGCSWAKLTEKTWLWPWGKDTKRGGTPMGKRFVKMIYEWQLFHI